MSVILEILEKLMQEVRHGAASPLPLSLPRNCLSLSLVALYRPMQRVRNAEMGLLLHWRNLVGSSLVVVSLFGTEQY